MTITTTFKAQASHPTGLCLPWDAMNAIPHCGSGTSRAAESMKSFRVTPEEFGA